MPEFIPKQYKKEQFTIRMEQNMLSHIDSLASKYNLSRSEFIVQCVMFALEHMSNGDSKEEEGKPAYEP